MATTITCLLLGLAYAWNVGKLARMSRSPDPWATADASSANARIEVTDPADLHAPLVGAQRRTALS